MRLAMVLKFLNDRTGSRRVQTGYPRVVEQTCTNLSYGDGSPAGRRPGKSRTQGWDAAHSQGSTMRCTGNIRRPSAAG